MSYTVKKNIRLTPAQAEAWDITKIRSYLDAGCSTKTKIVVQDVVQEIKLDELAWWTFYEAWLRLHNQLESKAKDGSTTRLFLDKLDRCKVYLEGLL